MSQWNTLSVPLETGLQCTLVLADQYGGSSGNGLRFMRNNGEFRELEEDRQDFDRYFRPREDLRTISGGAALRTIHSFLSEFLNVAHWNLPADNAGIELILKEAVANGRLVPVINRSGGTLDRVSRPAPAPLRWPSNGGGSGSGGQTCAVFSRVGSGLRSINDEPFLSGPYDPAAQEARLIAARAATAANDGGGDLLGVVEAVASAALAGDSSSVAGNSGYTSTLLADAQLFDYTPDAVGGDTEQIAGMPFHGAPGSWASSMPGTMPQLRQYGSNGTPMTDIDFEAHHGNANPHAHNWNGTSRDQGWPVSILP